MLRHLALLVLLPAVAAAQAPAENTSDSAALIEWLLESDRDLEGIPFGEVLAATSQRKILAVDPEADAAWLAQLTDILDETLTAMNAPDHPVRTAGRINEASRFIEDELLVRCNAVEGWTCGIPTNASGKEQRSGYPDLRLVLEDGSVVYLDPKLSATDSRDSSLRTFYYEPKRKTGKVLDDARHLLVGVHHNGGVGDELRLDSWELLDVSKLRVRLKAEFQASNKDMYRPETIVRQSEGFVPEP